LGAALVLAMMITGCGSGSGVSTGAALSGQVVGGGAHNPISGAAVTFYAMGSSGYGVGNTSLGTATSDSSGAWTINYSCPSGNSGVQTYVTAIGGDAGSGTNSAIGLMALAGPCNALSSSSFVMVNELATVAAEYALARFIDSTTGGNVGASSTNAAGLANAVNAVTGSKGNNGMLVTSYLPSGGTASNTGVAAPFLAGIESTCSGGSPDVNCDGLERLDTLANIIASCINASGPSSSACTTPFTKTGVSSSETMLAVAHAIATRPTSNVAAIYLLQGASATAPYQPNLTSQPADFTLALNFNNTNTSGANFNGPGGVAVDASGNVWVTNYGGNSVSELIGLATPVKTPLVACLKATPPKAVCSP
jgi:hypothetical protein